jgi:hypothetical protein
MTCGTPITLNVTATLRRRNDTSLKAYACAFSGDRRPVTRVEQHCPIGAIRNLPGWLKKRPVSIRRHGRVRRVTIDSWLGMPEQAMAQCFRSFSKSD